MSSLTAPPPPPCILHILRDVHVGHVMRKVTCTQLSIWVSGAAKLSLGEPRERRARWARTIANARRVNRLFKTQRIRTLVGNLLYIGNFFCFFSLIYTTRHGEGHMRSVHGPTYSNRILNFLGPRWALLHCHISHHLYHHISAAATKPRPVLTLSPHHVCAKPTATSPYVASFDRVQSVVGAAIRCSLHVKTTLTSSP